MNHDTPIIRNGRVIEYPGPIIWSADALGVQRAAIEASQATLVPSYPATTEIVSAVRHGQAVSWNGLVFNPEAGGNKVRLTVRAVPLRRADNQVYVTLADRN